MPKLNELGTPATPKKNCQPKYKSWSAGGTQKTLFNRWPDRKLEPAGNPAYEGFGYPAAGYGQSRRKVVPLAVPKVNGHVVGTRITVQGTLNPNNSASRREVAGSLAGLGCACLPLDHKMMKGLNGLGTVEQSSVQAFADAIIRGAVPGSLLTTITDKIITDEKANIVAYTNVQKLKQLDPGNKAIPALETAQQKAWGETNAAKFYALLIPEMQSRLGFTGGSPKVSAPDFSYIRAKVNPGVFSQVAAYLQDKVVGDAAQRLIAAKYVTDSSRTGLGFEPVTIGVISTVAAVAVAAALYAFIKSQSASEAASKSAAELASACASGRISQSACVAIANSMPKDMDFAAIAKWVGVGIGGLVVLQVVSSIRSAFPTR